MCGILGSFRHDISKHSLDLISHRGPDATGWFMQDEIILGHVRLSIQDTSDKANQPFFSGDGNIVMVYNGEVYNHWDIRKQLKAPESSYKTTSDTETILMGYCELGEDIFEKLNGIFALAIYDKTRNKLLLCRDRFGVKPLYYSFINGGVKFSSELKALIQGDEIIDAEGIGNYLRFLWSPGSRTPVQDIKKLLPGTILQLDLNKEVIVSNKKFFKPKFDGIRKSYSSEIEAIDRCEELLLQAVNRQLLSDVPVGFFLSGGVDSSLLVAMAAKQSPTKRLQCFTIDTGEFSESEGFSNDLEYAKVVANELNLDLEIVKAENDIVRDFDKMIWHLDEPQADAAPLNVLNISARAKEMGFKVLIGGAGGDDVFSGYRRHQTLRFHSILSALPYSVLKVIGATESILKPTSPELRRIKKLLSTFKRRPEDRIYDLFCWIPENRLLDLFTGAIKKNLASKDRFEYFRKVLSEIPREPDLLNRVLQLEMSTFLVDHNFNYTDKMGMAVGVEIRVPFLDNDLVDFSYSLPSSMKLKGKTTKYILKKVAERYLPYDVVYRSKAGFGAPVRKWITEDLNDMIEERLTPKAIREAGVFDPDAVWQLIKENKKGKIDASYPIWSLLAIDSWMRQFMNQNSIGN